MYERILIPLDGSPLAEQALPHAIGLAEHFHLELILLRVLIPLPSPPHNNRSGSTEGIGGDGDFGP